MSAVNKTSHESRWPEPLGLTDEYRGRVSGVTVETILSPPAVYVENGGVTPHFFQVVSPSFLFFVHYFLENVTREPPITPKGGI